MDHEPLEVEVEPERERHQDAQLQSVHELIGREEYEARLHDDAYETDPEVELEESSLVVLAHGEEHEDEDDSGCNGDQPDDELVRIFDSTVGDAERVANPRQHEAGVVDVDGDEALLLVALEAALLRWFKSHLSFSNYTLKNY